MKFKIKCDYQVGESSPWWEEYSENITNADVWAKRTIDHFNATLRPGERPRMLLAVDIIESGNEKLHEWSKLTVGMSVQFRGQTCDLMRCKKCGITGKRFGLKSSITVDSKYRKKVFRECDSALKELKRLYSL